MKSISMLIFTILVSCFLSAAQTPEKINYQTVIRNNDGEVTSETLVSIRLSVLKGNATQPTYSEKHSVRTNAFGLVNLEIGGGSVLSGDFDKIEWAAGEYFLQTELDINGGSNYILMGKTQLLSVPYALHAKTADKLSGGRSVGEWTKSGNLIYPTDLNDSVGIGTTSPTSLLHVSKFETEPTITIENTGSNGGATFRMTDQLSGADFKFKSTFFGDWKIRDQGNALDVMLIKGNGTGNVGIGSANPPEKLSVNGGVQIGSTFSSNVGTIRFNINNNDFEGYDGFVWHSLTSTEDEDWTRATSGTLHPFSPNDRVGIGTDSALTILHVVGETMLEDRLLFGNTNNNIMIGDSAGLHRMPLAKSNILIGYRAGRDITTGENNIALGYESLLKTNLADDNVAIGYNTMKDNLSGSKNVAIGFISLRNNISGSGNIAIGSATLLNNETGSVNVAIGSGAMDENVSGSENTAIGFAALGENISGIWNVAVGSGALLHGKDLCCNTGIGFNALSSDSSGGYNVGVGYSALFNNKTGARNVGVGVSAAYYLVSGDRNTVIGPTAGDSLLTANSVTLLGSRANVSSTVYISNATAIGANAVVGQSNALVLGKNADVGIGTSTPETKLHVVGETTIENSRLRFINSDKAIMIGDSAGLGSSGLSGQIFIGNRSGTNFVLGQANTAIGKWSMKSMTGGRYNTSVGAHSMADGTGGEFNTAVGSQSLMDNSGGFYNTAIGSGALMSNLTGWSNIAAGVASLQSNNSGSYNSAMGEISLNLNTVGDLNTGTGYSSLKENISGNNNTALGAYSGMANTTGSDNTFIGKGANANTGNRFNATAIGANVIVAADSAVVIGNFANVGIGTSTPSFKIDIVDARNSDIAHIYNTSPNFEADGLKVRLGPSTPGALNYYIRCSDGTGGTDGGIRGDGVGGVQFATTSDRRLKQNIVDATGSLKIIESIRPRMYEYNAAPGSLQLGFVAQELNNVFPQAVCGSENGNVDTEPMMVDYSKLTPLLTGGIKELHAITVAQQTEIEMLKKEIRELKGMLEK